MEKLWNKSFIIISITNFLMFFSFYSLLPILPLYIFEKFNAGSAVTGLILASYTIGALLCRPFAGYLVDSFSRKHLYFFTYMLFAFMFLGYLVALTLLLVTIARLIHGVSFGVVTTASNTLAVDVLPSSKRGAGIGYFGVTTNVAFALGPMAGITIYDFFGYNAVFILSFLTCLVGLLLVLALKVPLKPIKKDTQPLSLDRFFLVKATPEFLNLILVSVAYGPITNYLALYAKEIGIKEGVGYFYAWIAFGLVLSRLLTSRFIDRGYLTTIIKIGLVILILSYSVFSLFHSPLVFFASAFFLGIGHGLVGPGYQIMVINMAPHSKRGTASSTYLSAWDLGIGIGILFGAPIAAQIQYSGVFLLGAASIFLALILFVKVSIPHYAKNKLE